MYSFDRRSEIRHSALAHMKTSIAPLRNRYDKPDAGQACHSPPHTVPVRLGVSQLRVSVSQRTVMNNVG
jgi:hypothetical protein